jgi:hypothetical protein
VLHGAACTPIPGAWTRKHPGDAAIGMLVIQLLAKGILQQMVQPIAFGATLAQVLPERRTRPGLPRLLTITETTVTR